MKTSGKQQIMPLQLLRALTGRTSAEELVNSATHGLGLLLSIAGFAALVALAAARGGPWRIVSCSVYGATLVCLYAASTLYHGLRSQRSKSLLRLLDRSAIYLLIAGTYTPFTLVILRGTLGWSLCAAVWGLSLIGIFWQLMYSTKFRMLSALSYLGLGWLALIALKPLVLLVPKTGILLLLAGGALYTIGIGFFAWRRLPHHHAVWHIFVLGGSACHYFAVLYSVLLPKTS